jgi:hypothetical protein
MPVLEKKRGRLFGKGDQPDIDVVSRIVQSSNVESVAWPATGEPLMIVKYIGNPKLYGYIGVSRQRAVAAAHAASTGAYINSRIKGKYEPVQLYVH